MAPPPRFTLSALADGESSLCTNSLRPKTCASHHHLSPPHWPMWDPTLSSKVMLSFVLLITISAYTANLYVGQRPCRRQHTTDPHAHTLRTHYARTHTRRDSHSHKRSICRSRSHRCHRPCSSPHFALSLANIIRGLSRIHGGRLTLATSAAFMTTRSLPTLGAESVEELAASRLPVMNACDNHMLAPVLSRASRTSLSCVVPTCAAFLARGVRWGAARDGA